MSERDQVYRVQETDVRAIYGPDYVFPQEALVEGLVSISVSPLHFKFEVSLSIIEDGQIIDQKQGTGLTISLFSTSDRSFVKAQREIWGQTHWTKFGILEQKNIKVSKDLPEGVEVEGEDLRFVEGIEFNFVLSRSDSKVLIAAFKKSQQLPTFRVELPFTSDDSSDIACVFNIVEAQLHKYH